MPEEAKMAPPLRFQGFSDAWEQRKLGNVVKNIGTGNSKFQIQEKSSDASYAILGSTSVIGYDNNFDFEGNFVLTARVGANAGTLYQHSGKVKISDNTVYIQSDNLSFLYNLLNRFDLKKLSFGTGQPLVKSSELKKLALNFPNKEEQEKIGNFFNQLDYTIALHQQKQRQIRSLKQGFIKNLFPNNKNSAPRIRFSIFNDDWNQRNASEIFTSVSDKNYPELPVLSASQEKGMVLRESNGIDIKYDQKSTGTYKRVLPGQFVMHLRSFQGGFAYSTIEGITSPAYTILAFRNKEDHYPLFWKSIFSSKNFIKRLEAITYGIRDGRSISYADFSTLRFWIPSYEEQKQIGDFIESIDATIAFYQRQIDMMQSLKKELLNKMFI